MEFGFNYTVTDRSSATAETADRGVQRAENFLSPASHLSGRIGTHILDKVADLCGNFTLKTNLIHLAFIHSTRTSHRQTDTQPTA